MVLIATKQTKAITTKGQDRRKTQNLTPAPTYLANVKKHVAERLIRDRRAMNFHPGINKPSLRVPGEPEHRKGSVITKQE